jgi:hypothetical protein
MTNLQTDTERSTSNTTPDTAAVKKSWRDVLPPHPAANKIPVATAEERRVLDGDIRGGGGSKSPSSWFASRAVNCSFLMAGIDSIFERVPACRW